MAAFDENKPYGSVRGSSGVRYEQDGRFFNAQKQEVSIDGSPVKAAKKAPAKKAEPKAAPEGVRPMSEQVEDSE